MEARALHQLDDHEDEDEGGDRARDGRADRRHRRAASSFGYLLRLATSSASMTLTM